MAEDPAHEVSSQKELLHPFSHSSCFSLHLFYLCPELHKHCAGTGTPTAAIHHHTPRSQLPPRPHTGSLLWIPLHTWFQIAANHDSKISPPRYNSQFWSLASWRHGLISPWWITVHLSALELLCPVLCPQSFLWGLSGDPHYHCGIWLPRGAWLHQKTQFSLYTWPDRFYNLPHSLHFSEISISQVPVISCDMRLNFPIGSSGNLGDNWGFWASKRLLLTASRLHAGLFHFWTAPSHLPYPSLETKYPHTDICLAFSCCDAKTNCIVLATSELCHEFLLVQAKSKIASSLAGLRINCSRKELCTYSIENFLTTSHPDEALTRSMYGQLKSPSINTCPKFPASLISLNISWERRRGCSCSTILLLHLLLELEFPPTRIPQHFSFPVTLLRCCILHYPSLALLLLLLYIPPQCSYKSGILATPHPSNYLLSLGSSGYLCWVWLG